MNFKNFLSAKLRTAVRAQKNRNHCWHLTSFRAATRGPRDGCFDVVGTIREVKGNVGAAVIRADMLTSITL